MIFYLSLRIQRQLYYKFVILIHLRCYIYPIRKIEQHVLSSEHKSFQQCLGIKSANQNWLLFRSIVRPFRVNSITDLPFFKLKHNVSPFHERID